MEIESSKKADLNKRPFEIMGYGQRATQIGSFSENKKKETKVLLEVSPVLGTVTSICNGVTVTVICLKL